MRLKLDEDFRIEADTYSFVLKYEHDTGKLNDKGEPIISRDQWYYPTIKLCIDGYVDKMMGVADISSLREIVSKYDEVLRKIGSYSELAWNEKDRRIYELEQEIKDLKKELNRKK